MDNAQNGFLQNAAVSRIVTSITDFWKSREKKQRRMIIITAALCVVAVIVFLVILNTGNYTTLFTGLADSERNEIIGVLDSMAIDYQIDNPGAIKVKSSSVAQVRMDLATLGYPKTGLAYTPSTGGGMFDTAADRQKRDREDLQNRIAATINTLDSVDRSYVTLSLPDQQYFVSTDAKEPAKASVTLHLKAGRTLSEAQIQGIELTVASSVENLAVENVTLIDSTGVQLNSLTSGSGLYMSISDMQTRMERERSYEVEKAVRNLLTPMFGADKIIVGANVFLNFDSKTIESLMYGDGSLQYERIIGETTASTDNPGGVPGSTTNTDDPVYVQPDGETSGYSATYDETERKYLVSQVLEQVEKMGPEITSLSVSVMIDTSNMSEEESYALRQSISMATGAAIDDINVLGRPFLRDGGEVDPEKPLYFGLFTQEELVLILIAFVLLVIAVVVLIIVLKRRSRRKKLEKLAEIDELGLAAAQHAMGEMPGEIAPAETREQALKKQIKAFTDQNPEIVAQLVRTWLKEEDMAPNEH